MIYDPLLSNLHYDVLFFLIQPIRNTTVLYLLLVNILFLFIPCISCILVDYIESYHFPIYMHIIQLIIVLYGSESHDFLKLLNLNLPKQMQNLNILNTSWYLRFSLQCPRVWISFSFTGIDTHSYLYLHGVGGSANTRSKPKANRRQLCYRSGVTMVYTILRVKWFGLYRGRRQCSRVHWSSRRNILNQRRMDLMGITFRLCHGLYLTLCGNYGLLMAA